MAQLKTEIIRAIHKVLLGFPVTVLFPQNDIALKAPFEPLKSESTGIDT